MGTRLLWPYRLFAGGGETSAADSLRPPAQLPPHIAGLLFELGGVLYDDTVWQRWLLQLLGRIGLHTNYRLFSHVWQRDYLEDVRRGRCKFCDALRGFLLSTGLTRGQIDEVEAACRGRRSQLEEETPPLPGVKSTLRRLHENKLVMAVTCESEHLSETIEGRLRKSYLAGLFAAIVSSRNLGVTKPNPLGYMTAVKAMNLPPERVAYVGSDARAIAGAAELGMFTIAFNCDEAAGADVCLNHFEELSNAAASQKPLAKTG